MIGSTVLFIPSDKEANIRKNKNESFNYCPNICHLYAVDIRMLTSCNDNTMRLNHYCQICNGIHCHFCNSYCNRNHTKRLKKIKELKEKGDPKSLCILREDPLVGILINCRFDFGKPISENTKLRIVQKEVVFGKKVIFQYRIEVITKRNDKWLVSHPKPFLESWHANLDYQICIDHGKVFDYMTKYAMKAELLMIKGIASMIHKILR